MATLSSPRNAVAVAIAIAIAERLGESPALLSVALDVTNEAQAKAAVEAAVDKFGRMDVLVNNAGFGLLAAVEESSDAEVRRIYETNVFGLLNVSRAASDAKAAFGSCVQHIVNRRLSGGGRRRRLQLDESRCGRHQRSTAC